jgi:hypothetical protein
VIGDVKKGAMYEIRGDPDSANSLIKKYYHINNLSK